MRVAYKPLPNTSEGFLAEAEMYLVKKRPQDAEKLLRHGTEAFPDDASLWGKLGSLLGQKGPSAEATECFMNAWMLDPTESRTLDLACSLAASGRNREAEDFYLDLYNRPGKPHAAQVLTGLGTVYLADKKDWAAACFKKAADEGSKQAATAMQRLAEQGIGYVRNNWEAFKAEAKRRAPGMA